MERLCSVRTEQKRSGDCSSKSLGQGARGWWQDPAWQCSEQGPLAPGTTPLALGEWARKEGGLNSVPGAAVAAQWGQSGEAWTPELGRD